MTGDVVETLRALADNGWGIDDPTRDALLAGAAEVERLRRALVAMGQREAGAIAALTAERDRFREAAQTADSAAEREAIVWADRVVALEAERDRLRAVADAARAYVEGGEFSCDDVRMASREALVDALDALPMGST